MTQGIARLLGDCLPKRSDGAVEIIRGVQDETDTSMRPRVVGLAGDGLVEGRRGIVQSVLTLEHASNIEPGARVPRPDGQGSVEEMERVRCLRRFHRKQG